MTCRKPRRGFGGMGQGGACDRPSPASPDRATGSPSRNRSCWSPGWPVAQPRRRRRKGPPDPLAGGLCRGDDRLCREGRPRDHAAELTSVGDHCVLDELDRADLERVGSVDACSRHVLQLRVLSERVALCRRPCGVLLERAPQPGHEGVGRPRVVVEVRDVRRPSQGPQGRLPVDAGPFGPRAGSSARPGGRLAVPVCACVGAHSPRRLIARKAGPLSSSTRWWRLTPTPLHSRSWSSSSYLPTVSSPYS